MSISTYSQLKTALENFAAREGDAEISDNAADFVTLAESTLNTICPLNINRVDLAMTCAADSRNPITFPTDFVEPIALFLTTSDRVLLTPKIAGTFAYGTTSGTPSAWCINGAAIDLDVPCAAAETLSFRYRKSFALSDSTPTNWLLTNHPDVYLEACMIEVEKFLKDWDAAAARTTMLGAKVELVLQKESRSHTLAPLTLDAALTPRPHFNYTAGF